MLKFVAGNMFDDDSTIRVNTINCEGRMGKGIAAAFKKRYPEMFRSYKRACAQGKIKPGSLHIWKYRDIWVVNFPTKRHWRDDSRYEDIESGLEALRDYLLPLGNIKVSLPALGCGHGGLSWYRVAELIKEYLDDLDADIKVYTPNDSRNIT